MIKISSYVVFFTFTSWVVLQIWRSWRNRSHFLFLTLAVKAFICTLTFASSFFIPPLIFLSLLLSFYFLCFSFAVVGFYFIFPEEPPPRPPQPAVLIKSKSGFPQQLLTHCSCPLCSLLAPLLRGTSHTFLFLLLPVFAVNLSSTFISSLNISVSPSFRPCVPITEVQCPCCALSD